MAFPPGRGIGPVSAPRPAIPGGYRPGRAPGPLGQSGGPAGWARPEPSGAARTRAADHAMDGEPLESVHGFPVRAVVLCPGGRRRPTATAR